MGLEEKIHKKMLRIVLGKIAKVEEPIDEAAISKSLKESSKPRSNVREFLLSGFKEFKRNFKKKKKNTD